MLRRYPFDSTGRSTTNLVRDEVHTLITLTDTRKPRYIFTRNGAYYNDSLIVKQNNTKLVLNRDYKLAFFWQKATHETSFPVSTGIQIINRRLTGDIQVTYQVVGGEYQDRFVGLEQLLAILPHDVSNVFWDDIIEKPVGYEPVRHLHHINDVFGLSKLLGVLAELRRSLEGQSVLKLKSVYDRFLKLKQYVEANLEDIDTQRREVAKLISKIDKNILNIVTRDDLTNTVREEIDRLRTNINSSVDLATAKADASLAANERNKTDLNTLRSEMTQLDAGIRSLIATRVTALRQDIDTAKRELTTLITNGDKVNRDAITALDTKIGNRLTQLTNVVNGVNTSLAGQTRDFNNSLNRVKQNLEQQINALDPTAKLNQFNLTLTQLQTNVANQVTLFGNKVTELEGGLATQVRLLTTVRTDIRRIETEGNKLFDRIAARLNNLDTKTNTLETGYQRLQSEVSELNNTATTQINQLTSKQTELENKFNTEVGEGVKTTLAGINTKLKTMERSAAEAKQVQSEYVERIEELEARPIPVDRFNDEDVKRIIGERMNEIIIDKRNEFNQPSISIPTLVVYPDTEGGVVYEDNVQTRTYPVVYMDSGSQSKEEFKRTAFAPGTTFEFERNGVWSIPDMYDGMIAQVFVTAGIKGKNLPNGNILVYPPSTVMRYVKLKGGRNVPLTVGSISSFGPYITNDGTLSQKGLIQPAFPIVMTPSNTLLNNEDIRNLYGKLGKITIVV